MSDEQVVGTYKYLTTPSEFSSNLQPFSLCQYHEGACRSS